MLEAVHIGDLHLDGLHRLFGFSGNHLQINAVRRVIDTEYARGRKYFFLLGDLAQGLRDDTGNKIRLSANAEAHLMRLFFDYDGKICLIVYLGNHDFAEDGSHSLHIFFEMQRYKVFKTIKFVDKPTIMTLNGVHCHVLPHPYRDADPDADFAVGHYEVNQAKGDSGRILKVESKDNPVPTVLGHLHTAQKVRNNYFPGTLYQMNFGESLPKYYGLSLAGNGTFKFKHVQVDPPFKLINFEIEKVSDLKKLVSNPHVLYKLYSPNDVRLPIDLMERYPNIVNSLQFSSEEELEALKYAELQLEVAEEAYDHEAYLPEFFKSKGATSWQYRRAMEIMDDCRKG